MKSIHSSSLMTFIPSSVAFLSLEPAPGPAIKISVFFETEPETFAPRFSAEAFASLRDSFSSLPVKTTILPATFESTARGGMNSKTLTCSSSASTTCLL